MRAKRQQNQHDWYSQRLDMILSRRGRRARSGTLVEQEKLARARRLAPISSPTERNETTHLVVRGLGG